jgi:uncharacterized protein YkwD
VRFVQTPLFAILIVLGLPYLLALAFAISTNAATRYEMRVAINHTRERYSRAPVSRCPTLRRIAQGHSMDMLHRGYFGHRDFIGRVRRSGFGVGAWWAAETLAWSRPVSVWAIISRWLKSPPHRAIVLSPTPTCMGIGVAAGRWQGYSRAILWTIDWGRP